jgi:hypothetical protein
MWLFGKKAHPKPKIAKAAAASALVGPIAQTGPGELGIAGNAGMSGTTPLVPYDALGLVTPATFVESLVLEPCAPPDVRVLAGYPGPSSRGPGWIRLYLTLELDDWVDIYHLDILYSEEAGDQNLSGRALWIRKDAEVWHQTVSSRQVLAQDLLQGGLARRYLPRGVPSAAPPLESTEAFDRVTDPPSVGRYC